MECGDIKVNGFMEHVDRLHTTDMGAERIKKNLQMQTEDIVGWCRMQIRNRNASIEKNGKNWYITVENDRITVNAYSDTIITAHKVKNA